MNKPFYLGLSILDLNKTVIYECRQNYYVKTKHAEKTKLCNMDTDSLVIHVTTDDIYKDIAKDVETKFDTSNCVLYRPLLKEKKIKKVI